MLFTSLVEVLHAREGGADAAAAPYKIMISIIIGDLVKDVKEYNNNSAVTRESQINR